MLKKVKSSVPNLSNKELKAIKSLQPSTDITILLADKGTCNVALDESDYMKELNMLEFGV
jgi:hypothetical protein